MCITDNTTNSLTFTTNINTSRSPNAINHTFIFRLISNKSTNRNFISATTFTLIICRIDVNIFKRKVFYLSIG